MSDTTDTKIYTILTSSPEIKSGITRELICEGYDPEKARTRAHQKLIEDFGGDYWNMKIASQFSPHSTEYHYYAVPGVALSDVSPKEENLGSKEEICRPVEEKTGWEHTFLDVLDKTLICFPSDLPKYSTEHGIYGKEDFRSASGAK